MCGPDSPPATEQYKTPDWLKPDLRIETLPVECDGYTYEGSIAFRPGAPPAPVVLVYPNYAGLKQFDIDQAAFLARLGYVGVAVDLYKETPEFTRADRNPTPATPKWKVKEHFKGAFGAMNALMRKPAVLRTLMGRYLDEARKHSAVHPTYAGAIGYCFGGCCVLEMVRAGHGVQAVVSFHGSLQSGPANFTGEKNFDKKVEKAPNTYNRTCRVLIENGDLDKAVTVKSQERFKAEMDEQGIDWVFHNYARTPHGWALPKGVWATEYKEDSDRRSTLAMMQHFAETWPEFPQSPLERNAAGTRLGLAISRVPVAAKL